MRGIKCQKKIPQVELINVFNDGIEQCLIVDFIKLTVGENHVH